MGNWDYVGTFGCPANLAAEIPMDDGSLLLIALDCAERFDAEQL